MKYLILLFSYCLFISSSVAQVGDQPVIETHWNGAAYSENAQLQLGWAEEFFFNQYRFIGNERVLDIGSGDGKISAKIANALPKGRIVGIEKSSSMLKQAKKNHQNISNLSFIKVDAQKPSFYAEHRNQYDLVVSFSTLHWLRNQSAALKGVHQVLKPHGQFYFKLCSKGGDPIQDIADKLIQDEKYAFYFKNFVDPITRFNTKEYLSLLSQANLQVQSINDHQEQDQIHSEANLNKQLKSWLPHYHYLKERDSDIAEAFINQVIQRYLKKYPPDKNGVITLYDHYLEVVGRNGAHSQDKDGGKGGNSYYGRGDNGGDAG